MSGIIGGAGSKSGVIGLLGDIIAEGSNGNGRYIRFANGVQVCYNRGGGTTAGTALGNIFRSSDKVKDFPLAFSTTTQLAVIPQALESTGLTGEWAMTRSITTSAATLIKLSATSSGSGETGYIAIGRWK
jgi:hypothetical protein